MRNAIVPRLNDSRVPERIIKHFAEVLRKASILYHYDVKSNGGTLAPAISESLERMRYWALNLLITSASRSDDGDARVAGLVLPSLISRFEGSLRHFLDDSELRGQMPFPR